MTHTKPKRIRKEISCKDFIYRFIAAQPNRKEWQETYSEGLSICDLYNSQLDKTFSFSESFEYFHFDMGENYRTEYYIGDVKRETDYSGYVEDKKQPEIKEMTCQQFVKMYADEDNTTILSILIADSGIVWEFSNRLGIITYKEETYLIVDPQHINSPYDLF